MRAATILRQLCSAVAGEVHSARFNAVIDAADALVSGGRLSLTGIARRFTSRTSPKHRIKRMDRLLGNSRLHAELWRWYAALAARLLQRTWRPIVLLDWTQTVGDCYALVAAVPFEGRALPIYAEVHPHSLYGNRTVQQRFLAQLARVLGQRMRPVIVADAGFRTPFFRAVVGQGWDFVIRLRGKGVLSQPSTHARQRALRRRFVEAFSMADEEPRMIGRWRPHAAGFGSQPFRIVLGAQPHRRSDRGDDFYAKRALEPWLLATTLDEPAAKIVAIYARRMQIEESFRDTKSARLGWAFEHAASRCEKRQEVLLLIASLGLAATMLTGAAVEELGYAACFQANTVRDRRVQSLFNLGLFVLALREFLPITLRFILKQHHRAARLKRSWLQLRLPRTRSPSTSRL